MKPLFHRLWSLVAVASLALAPASFARADVWLFDVLTLRPEAAPFQADAYVGALELIARRHGGVRVASAREMAKTADHPTGHIVGLWRFRDEAALDGLLADPWYPALASLQDRTFDPEATRSLDRVRAITGGGNAR
jgi:hypothetical protein